MKLKQELHIPWLADFRDPWTNIHYHQDLRLNKRARTKHEHLESEVLCRADRVVATSKITASEFEAISKREIEVVTNGFEPVDGLEVSKDEKFVISHLGTLLSDRNPIALWKTIGELVKEDASFGTDFRLHLYGAVSPEVMESILQYVPQDLVIDYGYVSHKEVLSAQRQAHALLLVEMDRPETRGIIPGKLFEYLAAERSIIALGPEGSEVGEILAQTGAGKYFDYEQGDDIKQYIYALYLNYKNDEVRDFKGDIQAFTRKDLTKRMAAILSSMISETPA
ncbi:hypothetical protein [Aureitalea marina]|uniref:hypothetical protein n=1 Tax=Aureitalea marina TaxID=930804 RepID=UPI001FE939C8|nr:hypothetical protein [Aureitalea marina]